MIRIICGKYGLYKDGRVVGMGPGSEPFELTPERESELVAAGTAEYVMDPVPIWLDEQPEEAAEKPLEGMSAKELREAGKALGYSFKVGITKAEMIECIKHGTPEAAAPDDEGAPTFDAAEAVQ